MIDLDWLTALPAGWGLAGLFVSAFLSSTLLPGNSELLLAGWLHLQPHTLPAALFAAAIGNTLGGYTTYLLGKAARRHPVSQRRLPPARLQHWVDRIGSPILLFSWLPVIGDGLCLAAGWLGVPALRSLAWMAAGKTLRYLLVALPWL